MAIGDPYITREQLKAVLGVTDTSEDVFIDRCVNAASTAINNRSGWGTFWQSSAPETRSVPLTGRVVPVRRSGFAFDKLLLSRGISTATGFLMPGYSTAVLMPEGSDIEGRPFDSIRLPAGSGVSSTGFLDITAYWGWPSVPADIIWAAQMQSQRYYSRKGSPEGIAGSAEWGLSTVPRLDPDVLGILKDGGYMRAGIG